MLRKTLTIAGSDASGGAGIQADLKTFQEYGTFGFSAITGFVTMDPDAAWAHTVTPLAPELVAKQLKTIFTGAPIAAAKTGLLGSVETTERAHYYLKKFAVKNIVIDPVIASKGTSQQLLQPENVAALKRLLLPLATVATPNLVEAGILSEQGTITSLAQMKTAAQRIHLLGAQQVVVKGGQRLPGEQAIDLYYDGHDFHILENQRFDTAFNHGAGCTFAAAVTAGLAKDFPVAKAVETAKKFVAAAIANGIEINQYLGHVWHGAYNHAEDRMT